MRAYIFIKFEADANLDKIQHALMEPQIINIDMIMGPYDAVVNVDAENLDSLGKLAQRVRMCPGIRDSITCQVIS